jgi:hypothetical protein
MMSVYRELKDGEFDTTELDVHLERCPSCRQVLARDAFVGEQLRALPVIEPPPDMHAKLMRALASEHLQFMQRAAPGTVSTPEFLKPYLHEHAQSTHESILLSAFSTAETGPLPIIRAKRKGHPRSHMSHFAVLGLAAMFLIVLMMGGITSLLLLAHGNGGRGTITKVISNSIHRPIDIQQTVYKTTTLYQHVGSAVADRDNIYYSAYGDVASPSWMLLQLNRVTEISTPLLDSPSNGPLVILGSSPAWLVWLQYDSPVVPLYRNNPNVQQQPVVIPWSVRYLSLTQLADASVPVTPRILLQGTFNQRTAPYWVQTPIEGIWFAHNMLLVSMIDGNGIARLFAYRLGLVGLPVIAQLAMAKTGHIFASPTANSNGTELYWADEWVSDTGFLNSNIWTQQEIDAPNAIRPTHGRWAGHTAKTTQQELFRSDGSSFRPQIADDTLFWLSTAFASSSTNGTPVASGSPGVSTPQPSKSFVPRADTSIYAPLLDASVRGQVLMQPLDSDGLTPPLSLNYNGLAFSLQVGTDFALWQGDKGYEMYDVPSQTDVNVAHILDDAMFLAVNGDAAVWIVNNVSNTLPSASSLPLASMFAFNWPK